MKAKLIYIIIVVATISGIYLYSNFQAESARKINLSKAIAYMENGQFHEASIAVVLDIIKIIKTSDKGTPTQKQELSLYNYSYVKEEESKTKPDYGVAQSYIQSVKPIPGLIQQSDIDNLKSSIDSNVQIENDIKKKVSDEKVIAAEIAAKKANSPEERKKRGVTIGMTTDDVLASSWGKPGSVNKTTTQYGVHEQWVYGNNYLYFDDGKLTAIQN